MLVTSIILNSQLNEALQSKLEKMQIMKWLLDIDKNAEEVIFEDLQAKAHEIAYYNLSYLTVINQFVIQFPKKMIKIFTRLLKLENNRQEYFKLYEKFKQDIKRETDFIEFEKYVNLQINFNSEISKMSGYTMLNSNVETINELNMYNILLFNILEGSMPYPYFQKENYVYNFPMLYKWVKENKYNSVEVLTDDECKIIAGVFHSMSYDEMIKKLDLSILNQNYEALDNLILGLLNKFSVKNITQMIFRIILLKPYLFELFDNNLIVKGLKELNNVLL